MQRPRQLGIATILPIAGVLLIIAAAPTRAAPPLHVFGYFQTEFYHDNDQGVERNTFVLQQLNLFFQRDFDRDFTAFVNFELVNTYSSFHDWGSFNLEEAWVRYRASRQLQIKIGLQIPEFNNLNVIKNRTPLLPYIILPFIYETSFQEFFDLDVILPRRAFVQVYGTVPSGEVKLDYAFFLGNSQNVATESDEQDTPSGVDTTNNALFGGRVGVRWREFKAGVSSTRERTNKFFELHDLIDAPISRVRDVDLTRYGGDFSFRMGDVFVESEFLSARMDRDLVPGAPVKILFYYVTLGFTPIEQLVVYSSISELDIDDIELVSLATGLSGDPVLTPFRGRSDISLPTVGIAYTLNDRITLKAQVMYINIRQRVTDILTRELKFDRKSNIDRYAVAVSAFF